MLHRVPKTTQVTPDQSTWTVDSALIGTLQIFGAFDSFDNGKVRFSDYARIGQFSTAEAFRIGVFGRKSHWDSRGAWFPWASAGYTLSWGS